MISDTDYDTDYDIFAEDFEENKENEENDDWGDWEEDTELIDIVCNKKEKSKPNTDILSYEDIRTIVLNEMTRFKRHLTISEDDSYHLLMKHNWNFDKATNDFLENSTYITKITKITKKNQCCMVCFDDILPINQLTICNLHIFCKDCWLGYLTSKINDGIIQMCCMDSKCKKNVSISFIMNIFENNKKTQEKVLKWLLKIFIKNKSNYELCPNPKCKKIAYNNDISTKIPCTCGTTFCFTCSNLYHYPASCDVINFWNTKCDKDSENALWLMQNTKNCPKCKISIEKSHGCNHMTCENCKYNFCWLCKGDWKKHGSATGGFYKCNTYIEMKKTNQVIKEEYNNERFLHYFSRYKNHDYSKNLFSAKLEKIRSMLKKEINKKMIGSISFEQNIEDAITVLLNCRETLKWTYPIGFSITDKTFKNLFEYWQQDLEKYCEHLNSLIEVKSIHILWKNNREIMDIMQATKKYHKNLCDRLAEI